MFIIAFLVSVMQACGFLHANRTRSLPDCIVFVALQVSAKEPKRDAHRYTFYGI
jgi:hypothetical protein